MHSIGGFLRIEGGPCDSLLDLVIGQIINLFGKCSNYCKQIAIERSGGSRSIEKHRKRKRKRKRKLNRKKYYYPFPFFMLLPPSHTTLTVADVLEKEKTCQMNYGQRVICCCSSCSRCHPHSNHFSRHFDGNFEGFLTIEQSARFRFAQMNVAICQWYLFLHHQTDVCCFCLPPFSFYN